MIFDWLTYAILASIFVVQTLRMFVEKPKNAELMAEQPWQRWLKRRRNMPSK